MDPKVCANNQPEYEQVVTYSTCPTCMGSGKVNRDSDAQYIALIPANDDRLKPRRTYLKIGVAIIVSLAFFSLISFFLFTRSIGLEIDTTNILRPTEVILVHSTSDVFLRLQLPFNVINNNYVGLYIKEVNVSAYRMNHELDYPTQLSTNIFISPRQKKSLSVELKVTVKNAAVVCENDPEILMLKFQVYVSGSAIGLSMNDFCAEFMEVNCAPILTTTATPTPTTRRPTLMLNTF
ncbi:hypothetical protein Ciccas_001603 [Cichlidogyrus casuarinus]|uniref:Transmembrane protein 106 N-terminal domain-containing protein n=1 Tax=Cichlidogyrus casuarinus TaxID=1844966 RepID=A0ABD2QJM1_9PLAT